MEAKTMDQLKAFQLQVFDNVDMHSNISACLDYFFPSASFCEALIELYCSDDSLCQQYAQDFANRFSALVMPAFKTVMHNFAVENRINLRLDSADIWKPFAKCSEKALKKIFIDCVVLLQQLYQASRKCGLFNANIAQKLAEVHDAATQMLKATELKKFSSLLSEEVLASYGMANIAPKKANGNYFSRRIDLLAVRTNSESFQEAVIDECKSARFTEFKAACEKFLLNNNMTSVTSEDADLEHLKSFKDLEISDGALVNRAFESFRWALETEQVSTINLHLKLLRHIFLNSTDKNLLMRSFFLWNIEKFNSLPEYSTQYKNYSNELFAVLNQIFTWSDSSRETSHAQSSNVLAEIAGFVFISPKTTLWMLLSHCIENPNIVQKVVKIIRTLPALAGMTVTEGDARTCIIVFALRKLLEAFEQDTENYRNNFTSDYCHTICCMSRSYNLDSKKDLDIHGENHRVKTKVHFSDSVISGADLFNHLIFPEILKPIHTNTMLTLIKRLLVTNDRHVTAISWSKGVDDIDTSETVSASALLLLLLDIKSANFGNHDLKSKCSESLKLLSVRLAEDKFTLDEQSARFVDKHLNKFCWSVKYAISTWFADSLGVKKRQITASLFKSLAPEYREKFGEIAVDFDFDPVLCFLRSIFELAFFDFDLANDFLNEGFSILPSRSGVGKKVAQALCDAIPKGFTVEELYGAINVLEVLIDIFDPPRENSFRTQEFMKANYIDGLTSIEHLLILSEAVLCVHVELISLRSANSLTEEIESLLNQKSVCLLKAFCRLVRNHFDKEMRELGRCAQRQSTEIRSISTTQRRFMKIGAQLAQVFSCACAMSKYLKEVPCELRLLLHTLIAHQSNYETLNIGQTLDSIRTDFVNKGVVYVHAGSARKVNKSCEGSFKPENDKVDREIKNSNVNKRYNNHGGWTRGGNRNRNSHGFESNQSNRPHRSPFSFVNDTEGAYRGKTGKKFHAPMERNFANHQKPREPWPSQTIGESTNQRLDSGSNGRERGRRTLSNRRTLGHRN